MYVALLGTTKLSNVHGLVVAFVNPDTSTLCFRLRLMRMYARSFKEDIAKELSSALIANVHQSGIPFDKVVAWVHDACAVNQKAMVPMIGQWATPLATALNPHPQAIFFDGPFSNAVDNNCLSHTMDNIGADFTLNGVAYN